MQEVLLEFVESWPNDLACGVAPNLDRNLSHHYKSLPSKFWKWVRTLPFFDEMILYNISMRPEALNLN
jgi:hypothetical protein